MTPRPVGWSRPIPERLTVGVPLYAALDRRAAPFSDLPGGDLLVLSITSDGFEAFGILEGVGPFTVSTSFLREWRLTRERLDPLAARPGGRGEPEPPGPWS